MTWRSLARVLALALVVSCSRETQKPLPPVASDETPRNGGTVTRRLDSDVATLNPILATSVYDRYVDEYLFVPMLRYDKNLEVMPGLAEKWEISSDGREYTFHLNPKATFSDGTPVLASDVLFTLKKMVDPQSEAAQVGAAFELLDLSKTRIIDDRTIVIAFREALASQLIRFNDLMVVPQHVYSKGDFKTDFTSKAVGSGPYVLTRRDVGKEIILDVRKDYWGKRPYVDRVVFKVIVDINTAWNALKRGDIDETMISSDVWRMESDRKELKRDIDFRRFYQLSYNFIAWNGRSPLFSDKRVRRAMSMCFDVKSIISNLYYGTARPVTGPFTPDQWAYNPDVPVIPFDPAEAKRLLGLAGWRDTNGDGILDRDGKPFEFETYVFSGSATARPIAQLFQEELGKVGVKMNISVLDPAILIQRVLAGNYQSVYMAWDLDPDPDTFQAFHSSQFPPHGQNIVFYANPEVDHLIDLGRRELDQSKRKEIYRQIHARLAEDQPYTWAIQVSTKWAIRRRVHNVNESKGWGLFGWYPGVFDWWVR